MKPSHQKKKAHGKAASVKIHRQRGRPAKNPTKQLLQAQRRISTPPKIKISRRKRDLRLSAQQMQKMHAETFVMKLFDRSLDLSKYSEKTPLYPICRAWIANAPRSSEIRSYVKQRTPSPIKREDNGAEVLAKLRSGDITDVKDMPAPQKTDLLNIPPPLELDDTMTSEGTDLDNVETWKDISREELLKQHKNKWTRIKTNWVDHRKQYIDERYGVNHLIINELYVNPDIENK